MRVFARACARTAAYTRKGVRTPSRKAAHVRVSCVWRRTCAHAQALGGEPKPTYASVCTCTHASVRACRDLHTRTHANVQVYRRSSANVRDRLRSGGVRLRVRAYNLYARPVGRVRPHGRLRTRARGAYMRKRVREYGGYVRARGRVRGRSYTFSHERAHVHTRTCARKAPYVRMRRHGCSPTEAYTRACTRA